MSDWPSVAASRRTLGTWHITFAPGRDIVAAPSGNAWPTANIAYFVPITLYQNFYVTKLWWANGGTVGTNNLMAAVYTLGGSMLVSCASTLSAGANAVQSVAAATNTLLTPGRYYMALSCNGTTATVFSFTDAGAQVPHEMAGLAISSAAFFPLVTGFTLAAPTTVRYPICGISSALTV
jgi:hypothetical protein